MEMLCSKQNTHFPLCTERNGFHDKDGSRVTGLKLASYFLKKLVSLDSDSLSSSSVWPVEEFFLVLIFHSMKTGDIIQMFIDFMMKWLFDEGHVSDDLHSRLDEWTGEGYLAPKKGDPYFRNGK
jgi:hypothetical protein